MLRNLVYSKQLPFARVLMDSWYAEADGFNRATGQNLLSLKRNRLVDDSGGVEKYKQIEQLSWSRKNNKGS